MFDVRLLHAGIVVNIVGFTCAGCFPGYPTVRFVLPDGFKGEIRLILDAKQGMSPLRVNGDYVYTIPDNGILFVESHELFKKSHFTVAAYPYGRRIPLSVETVEGPLGEEPAVGPDEIVFHGLGWSQRGDEPPMVHFYVGSVSEFEIWERMGQASQ